MDDTERRPCTVCRSNYSDDDPLHNSTLGHRFNFLLWEWTYYRRALVKNRHGVEVAIEPKQVNGFTYNYHVVEKKGKHYLDISPENFFLHNTTLEFLCTIKNMRRQESIILASAMLPHPYKFYSLYDPLHNLDTRDKCLELEAGAKYTLVVKFCTGGNVDINSYKIPIVFNFQTCIGTDRNENPDLFTISRSIVVSIEEQVSKEVIPEKSPFTSKEWQGIIEIIPPTKRMNHMNKYLIPRNKYQCLKFGLQEFEGMKGEDYEHMATVRREMKPGYVTKQNYRMFWHNILWLEEMGQSLMLRRYNMENVRMSLLGRERLELTVPGLAEKRPSVIVGDMIEIRIHNDYKAFRGVIKSVNDKTVEISYIDDELLDYIKNCPTIELDVRFVLGRLTFERMHQGVDQAAQQNLNLLFPDINFLHGEVPMTRTVHDSEFFNQQIVSNKEQKTAVLKILNATSKNAPYIVFGPPGTGKTVTIVEAILQIMKKTTHRILVCAPANSACNMLTEKLMKHCTNKELLRIMSETVDKQSIKPHIFDYTNYNDGVFTKVTRDELKKYRIIITTLILIGGYEKFSPDVVFIDEAAQACEPEADVAIGLIQKGKQVVLAGDPKQLGPMSCSKVPKNYGFEKSLLERLMDMDLYKTFHPNFLTMLKLNFRSHSMILTIPNKLFYENSLKPMCLKSQNDPLAKINVYEKIQDMFQAHHKKGKKKDKTIRHPGQACEFCSILSKESRQGRSPSYFNTTEMQMVLKYIRALTKIKFEDDDDQVLPEQIGVVTPYIRQVHKIRETLRIHNFEDVEVGTTETFQGREKRVIIISTVRAQKDLLLYDKKYNLGFVKHPKRFNVALTRAMAKLIIIGCAQVLGTDHNWSAYMKLCEDSYAFFGAPYAKREQHIMEDIMNRMRHVQMLDTQHHH